LLSWHCFSAPFLAARAALFPLCAAAADHEADAVAWRWARAQFTSESGSPPGEPGNKPFAIVTD